MRAPAKGPRIMSLVPSMAEQPTELQKPAGAPKTGADEPVIHVIPEKFHGMAVRKKLPPARPLPAPGGPTPPGTPVGAGAAPKASKGPMIAIIALAAVILVGGGVFAFLYFSKPKAPPAPVCGDKQCAATESPFSCSEDCGPPPPVCGDKNCDAPGETPQTCSADCGPPPPVCGDRKCDAGTETPQNCSVDCGPPPAVCGDTKCEQTETFDNCPADCKPPEPTPGLDSESDGLTDEEEREVFGTDPNDPNTDNDAYVDLNEALNLFDPAKPAPSSLRDNPGISVYVNAAQSYEIFRPSAWTVREEDETKKAVFFTAQGGEFVEVLVQDKEPGVSLLDWYLAQAPGVTSSQVEQYQTKKGYAAVSSPDRQTVYVDPGNGKVWVISYNLGNRFEIQYKVTFQMMVQSIQLLP